ncbi:metallophosphoesterase [Roseobacter cerasinus]|uniref:Metallophosphoesterase n=1 Tax=Roseobacter cerasinus TaxID=2602289 RepID=A0A640VX67_9RHOB|nr:metallophosphoesterase family protein [Roseobacter cerasinus]GFE52497.1 metallophosphoesterase [Roseobacter cerasinus]
MIGKIFTHLLPGSRTAPPQPQVQPDHRIYAIGDIHGRADLLGELLDLITEDSRRQADARAVKYVFLGDYVDRGEQSRAVLDRLLVLQQAGAEDAIFLKGNHEAALLDFLQDPVAGRRWLDFGGARTLKSYGLDPDGDPERLAPAFQTALGAHLAFLQETERFWQSGEVLFVHAAVDPRRALADQRDRDLLWGNTAFLRGRGLKGLRVVHGHYNGPEPVVTPARICVDTGAYYSDRLTAVCLDESVRFLHTGRGHDD